MENELLIAIFAGLGGMLGWGLADFFAKKTIDKIGDVVTLFWSQLFGIVPLLILFLLQPSTLSLSTSGWLYLLILGVTSGLSYIPTYVAFGKGKVSLLSPIFASYSVAVALYSALIFGEVIPFSRIIAFIIVFVGILLINGDPRSFLFFLPKYKPSEDKKVSGLKEIIWAVVIYSAWLVALDQFISGKSWILCLLIIRILSAISLFFYSRATKRQLLFRDKGVWKFLIIIGIFDVAAYASITYGFSATSFTSIVALLSAAFSLPTILLARVFLKEKATRLQTVGSLIIIIGVILVSLL